MLRYNFRVLFPVCQFILAICMLLIGICTYLQLEQLSWVPLACAIVIFIMRSSGIHPVMHILMNELYPTEIRAQAIAIEETITMSIGACHMKLFPLIRNTIGYHGACFIYATFGVICAIWGAVTIPDNRGKSLVKVEQMYEEKGNNKDKV